MDFTYIYVYEHGCNYVVLHGCH